MMELIEGEAALGRRGRIIWKLNNLVDRGIIDALYAASAAGVEMDLIVRAICGLRPGVPGLSDNIRVRSIVGRWLEHSRIFYFGAGEADAAGGEPAAQNSGFGDGANGDRDSSARSLYLLGSADMMERNLDRRVEAVVPVQAPELRARLREILELDLADDTRAWELDPDGTWHKVPTRVGVQAQHALQEEAISRSRRRREPAVLHGAPPG
jgi:polyphosphate kinase